MAAKVGSKQRKEPLHLEARGIGATLLGVIMGALLLSPAVSLTLRVIALVALGGVAVLRQWLRPPKTVRALAAAGAPRTEIAWKTRLPVDAVNMLLDIGTR